MIQKRIVFVCLGNICRSPLAEAIFISKAKEKKLLQYFEADSCGTSNYQIGDTPDHRTVANATKNGIVMNHIARQIRQHDLDYFDLIVAMDKMNHRDILRLAKNEVHQRKIMLMRDFDSIGNGQDVPDPYHGGEGDFQEVFEILNRSMDYFIEDVEKQLKF
ncbi:MAG TPA: low molecular weight protein-tyrosine-phosphatase [Chryseolinea sp.]|nr:low molecular weight protein-tyrosine-phosphatase [Chryseolinea sp.]HPH46281.1 low molecular weight protein-tyrosine-phosphatase [Chryseolinea sp.]HPM29126.1 low molecular weight protein-tyrosine-phosphatase [Chryseolinea sp.]